MQKQKQREQRISTEFGIQIDPNDEHSENADDSIRPTCEPYPSTISVMDLHSEKQKADKTRTLLGIITSES
jgi:hypothetical protein